MKSSKFLLATLLVGALALSAGNALGKDEKSSKSEKSGAAVGNKELLARIELIEQVLADLQGLNADVAGSVYSTFQINNGFGVLNEPAEGHFQLIGSKVRTLIFGTDNTGSWSQDQCSNQQLSEFGGNPAVIQSSPGCAGPSSLNFTYVQVGNLLEITLDNAPGPILLIVSNDGSVLGSGGGGSFGNPSVAGGVNGVSNSLIVGLRLSN